MAPIELIYRQIDGLDIYLDVYIPSSASEASPAPAVLWWHGGGLLQGTRKGTSPHQLSSPEKHGICFISADYRLAPQTRLPDILSDCSSAIEFIRSDAFAQATGSRVDSSKIVLSGSSAGGYLALLGGTGIGYSKSKPPPKVSGIAVFYPITDLLDPFWTTKQHPVSYFKRVIADAEVQPFINPTDPKTSYSSLDSKRAIFYHYMVQEGILQSLLLEGTGIDPAEYSVAAGIKSGKFTVPPTYIAHGSIDDKVPPRQSTDVVNAMKETGMQIEYEEFEGFDHLFDKAPACQMDNMYASIKRMF